MENKMTVLVVDDEELLRNAIVFQFKREGFNVLSASNGVEAFDIIKTQKVDAVVSDIQMPGGNGVDLLKDVKAYNAEIPVMVFITAFADITEAEAYDLGANAIFAKPFDRKMLVKCIKDSIQTKGRLWHRESEEVSSPHMVESTVPTSLGRGGAVIPLNSDIKVGEVISFKIPAKMGSEILSVQGTGKVRWIDPDSSAGLEFTTLEKDAAVSIDKWLDENPVKPFIPRKAS